MPYIGKSPTGSGVRQRYVYTATGGETSLSGADDNSKILKFTDGEYVDVYLNGILLIQGSDYGVGTANTISSLAALAANDVVEIIVYDIYNVAKINSEAIRNRWYYTATGGETSITTSEVAGLSFNANAEIEVRLNGVSLQQGVDFNTTTANQVGGLAALTAGQVVEIIHYADFQLADTVSKAAGGTFGGDVTFNGDLTVDTDTLYVDSTNDRVGVGTTSPASQLEVANGSDTAKINLDNDSIDFFTSGKTLNMGSTSNNVYRFFTNNAEAMRLDGSGNLLVGTTSSPVFNSSSQTGLVISPAVQVSQSNSTVMYVNRIGSDGQLIGFYQAGVAEGNISVSGSTVSYNGGHLARWSRLADSAKDTSIVKGTVMTNLDQMVVWTDADGNTEDNEQLNCMAVSSVEGDANVAGVFVNWDDEDDYNDMNIAMTGDMVIRIASGTTVARGDLLMSAGDGTAKPQGDDIVRSKTIAKVTSTTVSHTYDDGSYLVPCVLMAC